MRTFRFLIIALMCLTLLLTACGSQQKEHEDMAMPAATSEVVYEPGAWMSMTLTDSRTGNTFKLTDYSGKVVILEMMDPGCPICKDQLKEIVATLEVVGDNVVAVSVDVGYKGVEAQVYWADKYGATWMLAQRTKEFGQSLISDFGGKIIYPGDTPVIIIDPSGTAHVTDPGIKKSATLIELINSWTQ
jgi:peroxiredoxin